MAAESAEAVPNDLLSHHRPAIAASRPRRGMNLAWTVAGAAVGVLAGAALRGPVFRLSALGSLALLAARRISWRGSVCFGPFMLAGALAAISASGLTRFLD